LLLAITALCWGSTPILEKVGLKEVDPFVGVTVRSMAITAVLLAVAALSGRLRDIFSVHLHPLVTALLGMLLLGEQVTLLRFLGIVLIVVGIWLVK